MLWVCRIAKYSLPAQDEEQQKSYNHDGEDDPSHPIVPGTAVAASPAIAVIVASSHGVLASSRW